MWTKEQEVAIKNRDENMIISAGAGSGKTAVLVERIIDIISNPDTDINIDELLVVTFTNAAASEMKERIVEAINKKLLENPENKKMYKQSLLVNNSSIMTLHSFCLKLIKENYYHIGLDPKFSLVNSPQIDLIKEDIIQEILEKKYSETDDVNFNRFVSSYSGQKNDNNIVSLILKLSQYSLSNPGPETWLNETITLFESGEWRKLLIEDARKKLVFLAEYYELARIKCTESYGPEKYFETVKDEHEKIKLLLDGNDDWDELKEAFDNFEFKRLPTISKKDKEELCLDESLIEEVKSIRNDVKKEINDIKNVYFNRGSVEIGSENDDLKPLIEVVIDLTKEFQSKLSEYKFKKNYLEFNDLEHYALKLLRESNLEIRESLKVKYKEILIDEYQDTNDVQESIVSQIKRNDNVFVVGDVKQSIYSFRLAKPKLFLDKYEAYRENPSQGKVVDLNRNFRCRKSVIDFTNFIFKQIMTKKSGEVDYSKDQELIQQFPYENLENTFSEKVEIDILDKSRSSEDGEAVFIARRIRKLMKTQPLIYDKALAGKNKYRNLEFKDIVVLMRSPKNEVEKLVETLREYDIPVYAETGSGYFKALEIQIILSLLKVLDNPYQDIPFASLLRSPIFNVSEEKLAEIRALSKNTSFYEAFLALSETDESMGSIKERLGRWRKEVRQGSLSEFISRIYKDTFIYEYMGALSGGKQRQANLRAFYDRTLEYEKTNLKGLFMFLRFIEKMEETDKDLEVGKSIGENENVVRIMSIHKSKGLEFPVVIVAGLGKNFNHQDLRSDFLLHRDLGVGPQIVDIENRVKYPSLAKLVIKNRLEGEFINEEMRILYVAFTRAREKLILLGSIRKVEDRAQNLLNLAKIEDKALTEHTLSKAQNMLEWILLACARHKTYLEHFGLDLSENMIVEQVGYEINPSVFDEMIYKEDTKEIDLVLKNGKLFETDGFFSDLIERRLGYRHLNSEENKIKIKYGVTEINKLTEEACDIDYQIFQRTPNFVKKKSLTAAEKGNLFHKILEILDFKSEYDLEKLKEESEILYEKGYLTELEFASIEYEYLLKFFNSEIYSEIKMADELKRELPFSVKYPANDFFDDYDFKENNIIVQGIIDCLWRKGDQWFLLDYKSDFKFENKEGIIDRYSSQMKIYKDAFEKGYDRKISNVYLYSISTGKIIEVEWSN